MAKVLTEVEDQFQNTIINKFCENLIFWKFPSIRYDTNCDE